MQRYFTFFFVSREESPPREVLKFVDWLLHTVPIKGQLHVIAREVGRQPGTQPVVQGKLAEYRSKLDGLPLASLNISSLNRTTAGTELFIHFEQAQRERGAADILSANRPAGSTLIKLITFSLRSDLWISLEQNAGAARLLLATEELFSAHDCIYGYGHETPYTIPGRFSLIEGNANPLAPRIVDFDYGRYIEDVYRYNYVAESLLAKLDMPRLCRPGAAVECKDLRDPSGNRKGLAIYLDDDSAENRESVRRSLDAILWKG